MDVAALTLGDMSPMTLFTLRRLARSGHRVTVVHAAGAAPVSSTAPAGRMLANPDGTRRLFTRINRRARRTT